MSVLVLSEECDPTADAVIESLQRHDASVYRVDLGWFPSRLDLDAVLGVAGWTGALRTGNRESGWKGCGQSSTAAPQRSRSHPN